MLGTQEKGPPKEWRDQLQARQLIAQRRFVEQPNPPRK
jgi:hypothetical protein